MSCASRPSRFIGRVVIVTGSSSGIGRNAAMEFAKEGALLETEQMIIAEVPACKVVKVLGCLEDDETATKIIEGTIKAYGKVDVLVNNAATVIKPGYAPDSMETLEFLFRVNFKSVAQLTQLAIPHLLKTKGNIVNVSTCASVRPYPALIYCGALKAALDQLTRTQAQIYGPEGVRVNTINPGPVRTALMDRHHIPGFEEFARAQTSLRRIGLASEMSTVILFLASEEASFVTGANWMADGGACCTVPAVAIGEAF